MRARGLKQDIMLNTQGHVTSRPMRARGLKHGQRFLHLHCGRVAPHAGARIETRRPEGN